MASKKENIISIGIHLFIIIFIIFSFTLIKDYITTKNQLKDMDNRLNEFIEVQKDNNKIIGDMLVNTNYYLGRMIVKDMEEDNGNNKNTDENISYISSMVSIYAGDRLGSGFIISPYGHIITTNDSISDQDRIEVDLFDGSFSMARIVNTFQYRNLAIIRVVGKKLPYLRFGDSSGLKEGQIISILNHPVGYLITNNTGVITNLNSTYFEFSSPANNGRKGGPILDENNRIIGIISGNNTAFYSNDIIPLLSGII